MIVVTNPGYGEYTIYDLIATLNINSFIVVYKTALKIHNFLMQ